MKGRKENWSRPERGSLVGVHLTSGMTIVGKIEVLLMAWFAFLFRYNGHWLSREKL